MRTAQELKGAAQAAFRKGKARPAARLYRNAIVQAEKEGWPPADIHVLRGRRLLAYSDRGEAIAAFDAALAEAADHEEALLCKGHARTELARSGEPAAACETHLTAHASRYRRARPRAAAAGRGRPGIGREHRGGHRLPTPPRGHCVRGRDHCGDLPTSCGSASTTLPMLTWWRPTRVIWAVSAATARVRISCSSTSLPR